VNQLLQKMSADQEALNQTDFPKFEIVDIQGTAVHYDTIYQAIADRLGIEISG
jgi:hypothetical protein